MKKIIILFSIIALIVFIGYNNKKNKIKICLCVIGKNENLYAKEFVEHYKKIGYNNIILYDNNEKNGEHFEDVINDYIKNGFVKIIDWREKSITSSPQFDSYRDCYQKFNKKYDWLSFYDMDEFLEINKKYNTIQDFFGDKIFQYCQVIKINWLMYNNDNTLYYENKPLEERMKSFNYNASSNKHIKSTIKGNLPVNYWEKTKNAHSSILNITSCNCSGKKIRFDSPFSEPPDFTNAKLKHYYFKSFEEYCLKINRGRVSIQKNNSDEYRQKIYKLIYFQNKDNNEKIKIMKNLRTTKRIKNSKN